MESRKERKRRRGKDTRGFIDREKYEEKGWWSWSGKKRMRDRPDGEHGTRDAHVGSVVCRNRTIQLMVLI